MRLNFAKNDLPLVTVVTVVYNDASHLEATIQNVLNQTYPNLEYIIIDGGSTDGTLEVIKKYESELAFWVSEKDQGIYDAMNKGTRAAKGAWVNFMNSQDLFFDSDVIKEIFNHNQADYDVIYGNVLISYPNGFLRLAKPRSLSALWQGMICSHQAVFVRSELLKKMSFDLKYKLAADFDLLYKLKQTNHKFLYAGLTIAKTSSDGVSDQARIRAIKEYYQIVRKFPTSIFCHFHYNVRLIFTILKLGIKNYLPKNLVNFILRLKYLKKV